MGSIPGAPRAKVVRLIGQGPKYTYKGKNRNTRVSRENPYGELDLSMAETCSGVGKVNHSKYWGVRFHEPKERFGSVKVYAPDGTLVREIPKEALTRPFPIDPKKNSWNTMLYSRKSMGL